MSSANKGQFYFFLLDMYTFYFLLMPHCTIQNFCTILSKSGESGPLRLVPNLRGMSSIIMLAVSFCRCSLSR